MEVSDKKLLDEKESLEERRGAGGGSWWVVPGRSEVVGAATLANDLPGGGRETSRDHEQFNFVCKGR